MTARGSIKRIRPSTSNRSQSLEALWFEVLDSLPHAEKTLTWLTIDAEHDLREGNAGALGMSFKQLFDFVMTLAVCALWQGRSEARQRLREAFSFMYWGAEIAQHERIRERIAYDMRDSTLFGRLWLHGLAAAGGAPDIADWTAPYVSNIFSSGDGTGEILELAADTPFRIFFQHLIAAHVQGRWSSNIDQGAMRAYGDLIVTAEEPSAFRAALVDFCDYRVAQALRFDGLEAPRRRPESLTRSVLDVGGWIRLLPLELFSLRYVYEKTTGRALLLEAGHPLLETPLMKVPPLLPLYEDDFIRRTRVFAQKVFASAWKPLDRVRLTSDK